MRTHFNRRLLFALTAALFLVPGLAWSACATDTSSQDASHIKITGLCASSSEAKLDCQAFAQSHNYAPACNFSVYPSWSAGWLCESGQVSGYCVYSNGTRVGYDPNYHNYLGDYYFFQYFASTSPISTAQCEYCVGDPINPVTGAVFTRRSDSIGDAAGMLSFNRSYNSMDAGSTDLHAGWRHRYSRKIVLLYSSVNYQPRFRYSYNSNVSSPYSDAGTACTTGFSQIKGRVANWQNATTSFTNGICTISIGDVVVGTLPITGYLFSSSTATLPPNSTLQILSSLGAPIIGSTVGGYDVTRDDGQLIRFFVNNGIITAPAGVSLKLQQTQTGYTVIDTNNNVEQYDTNGKLLSVTSRAGIVQTMNYDATGRLSGVTDSFGHQLIFTYDPQGHLSSVTTQ